jgi:hypothetical protein
VVVRHHSAVKNPKLTPKWVGPYKIIDMNNINGKLEIKPNKFKIINIQGSRLFMRRKKTVILKMNFQDFSR